MGSSSKPQLHNNLLGHRIAHGRLELVAILGVGAYGVVYLARDLVHPLHAGQRPWDAAATAAAAAGPTGDASLTGLYAVKCLHRAGLEPRQQLFQEREIALHSLAGAHPGVVTLYQVLQDSTCVYVVMDYCPDGDLFAMITEAQRYAVPTRPHPDADPKHIMTRLVVEDDQYLAARAAMDCTVKDVFCQIVNAAFYCHQLGIYHRDLKPENILCVDGGARVLIADFGLATSDAQSEDFGCGSTFYMGPECQGGIVHRLGSYDTAANDVWSLGVILVNLVCGRNPWKQATASDETFREYLRNPDFLREILPISDELNLVLRRVFSPFPEKRCPLGELAALVQGCDRLTATNSELKARQEARHRAQSQAQLAAQAQAQAQAHILAVAQARAAREHAPAAENISSVWRKPSLKATGVSQEPFRRQPTAVAAAAAPFSDTVARAAGSPSRVPHRIRTHTKTRSLCQPIAPAQGESYPTSPFAHRSGHARHASFHVPLREGEGAGEGEVEDSGEGDQAQEPAGLSPPFQLQNLPPLATPSSASPATKVQSPLSPSAGSLLDSSEGWDADTGTPSTPTSSYSTASHTGLPPTPRWVAPTVPLPPVSPVSASARKPGSMAAFSRIVQHSKNSLLELNPFPGRRARRTTEATESELPPDRANEAWEYDAIRPPLSALGFVPDTRVGL